MLMLPTGRVESSYFEVAMEHHVIAKGCGGCTESKRMWKMFREYKDVEDVQRV